MKKFLVVLLMLIPLSSYSTGLKKISLDKVVSKADFAFEGVCVSSKSYRKMLAGYTKGTAVTDYEFKVTKWIKSPEDYKKGDLFSFTQRGVPAENFEKSGIYASSWLPTFSRNKSYLVFLRKTPEGLFMPVGNIQGMSEVVLKDGVKTVKNHYMKSLVGGSSLSSTKSLSHDVNNKGEMNYDLFVNAVESSKKDKGDSPSKKNETENVESEANENEDENVEKAKDDIKILETK